MTTVLECTYATATKYAKKKEVRKIHQFLVGLNIETYKYVRFIFSTLRTLVPL